MRVPGSVCEIQIFREHGYIAILIWIAGSQIVRRAEQPLPLIMFDAPCFIRERTSEALDKAGIPWRIAVVSASVAGLWAVASAGLGVTVRTDLGLPANLTAGAAIFDLARLGSLPVTLHKGADGPAAVERLAEIMSALLGSDIMRTSTNRIVARQTAGKSRKNDSANAENKATAKSAKLRHRRGQAFSTDQRSRSVLPAHSS